jgi:uncharacterized membrane protein
MLAILAGMFNGIGDFFTKLTAGKISPYLGGIILSIFAAVPSALYLIFIKGVQGNSYITKIGFLYSALGGLTIGIGVIFFFVMFNKGVDISQAQPIVKTALILTAVILGVLVLREKISMTHLLGMVFSLIGIYFLTK